MSTPYGPKDPTPSQEPQQEQPTVIVPAETPSPEPEPQEYLRPTIPGQTVPGPNQMIMKPTSVVHGFIRGGLALFLAIAGAVNAFWGTRFPDSAFVEGLFMVGITIDLFGAAVVLGIFAILAAARRSVPVKPQSVSPMAIVAVILSGIAALVWLLGGLAPVLTSVAAGERYQYMTAVGAIFFLGIPWVLGTVFGALSLRSGGRLTPILGTIAIVLGVVLAIAAVTFAVIYGLGLSD